MEADDGTPIKVADNGQLGIGGDLLQEKGTSAMVFVLKLLRQGGQEGVKTKMLAAIIRKIMAVAHKCRGTTPASMTRSYP